MPTIHRFLLTALAVLASAIFPAFAFAETRLVIDLEGTLVQGIPPRNKDLFAADDVIALSSGKFFVKLPQAETLIQRLTEVPDLKIYAMAGSQNDATGIANQLKTADGKTLASIAVSVTEDRLRGWIGLRDDIRTFIVSVRPVRGVGPAIIMLPQPLGYFHFPSFETSQKEAQRWQREAARTWSDNKTYFPETSEQWDMHVAGRGRLFSAINELMPLSLSEAKARSAAMNREDLAAAKAGEKALRKPFTRWRWAFETRGDQKVVSGCLHDDADTEQVDQKVPIDECIAKLPVKRVWDGPTRTRCLQLTDRNEWIGEGDVARCEKTHWLKVKGASAFLFVEETPDMGGLSEADLEKKYGHRFTLRNMLIQRPELYSIDYTDACYRGLKRVAETGGDLSSSALRAAIVPLGSLKMLSGVQDATFYHYSRETGVAKIFELDKLDSETASRKALEENRYQGIFDFLRNRRLGSNEREREIWFRVFYVAEDPTSTQHYGNYGYEFKLDLGAPTVTDSAEVIESAVNEVIQRHGELEPCRRLWGSSYPSGTGYAKTHRLFYLIAEESGVQIVDYRSKHDWFQILSPAPFREVKFYRK